MDGVAVEPNGLGPFMRFNHFYVCVLTLVRGKPRRQDHKPRKDRGVNPSWPVIGGGELKYIYGYLLRSTTV